MINMVPDPEDKIANPEEDSLSIEVWRGNPEILAEDGIIDRLSTYLILESIEGVCPQKIYNLIRSEDYFEQLVRHFSASHREVRRKKTA
jgi:hypothetical protein